MEAKKIEEEFEEYLNTITTENTKKATRTTIKRMVEYFSKVDINEVKDVKDEDIDIYLKRELTGKSATTISNEISRIKKIFRYFDKPEVVEHLNLNYFKTLSQPREDVYLTPNQVYELIESLLNYQDKALVLMCYMNLYDNDFETIRKLRKDQFKGNKLVLDNGEEVHLNFYCKEIIRRAIIEDETEKYIFQEGRASKPYKINDNTPYIFKSKIREGSAEVLPSITLKKKFDLFAKYSGIKKLSPIMIKNSRFVYDLVKLEFEENLGVDINQLELKDYCQEQGMVGQIEKLNMVKKSMKLKIINEIISGKTYFID